MNTSEKIDMLCAALSKAQGEMEGAIKDANNPFFKSKYADLASVRDATREPFKNHGLAVVQFPKAEFSGTPEPYEWKSKAGETRYGVRVVCVVSVVTRLVHESGQFMEDAVSTMLPTGDPQSVGSAISYLRRYAWQSVAGVAPEDDDGEAAHRGNGGAHRNEGLEEAKRKHLEWEVNAARERTLAQIAEEDARRPADPLTNEEIITLSDLAKAAGFKARPDILPTLAEFGGGAKALKELDRAHLADVTAALKRIIQRVEFDNQKRAEKAASKPPTPEEIAKDVEEALPTVAHA